MVRLGTSGERVRLPPAPRLLAARDRRRQAGLTLIELMVAMVIVSLAIAAAFAVGHSMMNGYRTHRKMTSVERSARASLEIIGQALRASSPGVPSGNIQDLVGCTNFGAMEVLNSTTGPDRLTLIHASGGVLTSLRATFDSSSSSLVVLDGSQLRPGDYVVVTDLAQGHLVRITGVSPGGGTYTLTTPTPSSACGSVVFPPGGYGAGSLVIRARISRFFVDSSAAVGFVPTLMLDPDADGPAPAEPMAEGVEDLQLAVGVDANGDGSVSENGTTLDEWHYNVPGDAPPPSLATAPPRAFRVTLVARSVLETEKAPMSTRPAVEDRAGASGPDEFRRRVLSSTIEVRNTRGSPL